jgi:transcription elongation factor GreA
MEFLTPDEKTKLEDRLEELKANRPVISKRIAEARALGDLKENAEFHAAREDQGVQEAEIRRIEERLGSAKVIEKGDVPEDIVFLGATVKLREEGDDEEEFFRLVGEPSGDLDADIVEVSVSSPMGEALLKARVGETVRVDTPRGVKRFEVIEIV